MKPFVFLNPQETMPHPAGWTPWQNSAASCSRCHGCSQSCPSYLLKPEEIFSPRGRIQLIHLLLSGKLHPRQNLDLIESSVRSCILCARCHAACAGQVPVAHQILALAQAKSITLAPALLRFALWLRSRWKRLFTHFIQIALFLRRTYLSYLFYPLFPAWLKHLHRLIPAQSRTTHYPAFNPEHTPDLIYLPSWYAHYVDDQIFPVIQQLTHAKQPLVFADLSSGLEYYLYNGRALCLQTAKKLLIKWEQVSKRPVPLVTDSLEIYLFLKNYPFLFTHLPGWKKRAEQFACHVQFITDFKFPKSKEKPTTNTRVALDSSTILYPAGHIQTQAQQILKTHFGKNLVECEYNRFTVPVAGFSLAKGTQAKQITAQYVQEIAQQSLTAIYCLSGWAVLELNVALKQAHLATKATHFLHIPADYGTVQERNAQIVRRRKAKPSR